MTISGRGFPDSSLTQLGNTVNISVGGQPCSVVSSTYSTVVCSTPSQAQQPQQQSVAMADGSVLYPVSLVGSLKLACIVKGRMVVGGGSWGTRPLRRSSRSSRALPWPTA